MKSILGIIAFLITISVLPASMDLNNPKALRKNISDSQFVFIGSLQITDYRFLSESMKVAPDIDGKILKAYKDKKFDAARMIVPSFVNKWAVVKPIEMLKGDEIPLEPYLKVSWIERCRVNCPHRSQELSGDKRIWFLSIHRDKSLKIRASLVSMSLHHLEEVKNILRTKMENRVGGGF